MELSNADEIAAAFDTVDELVKQAAAAAPAVALLLERARQQGMSEHHLAANLRTTTAVLRWLLKLNPDAAADRIDLDGDDVGALLIRWVQSGETGAIGHGVSALGQSDPAENT